MWWIVLGWLAAAFVVAIIFGHAASRDEGADEEGIEEIGAAVDDGAVRAYRHSMLH
ncbi:MAG: hypothetical protein ACYDHM_01280 [Acidiferrobacterales bacterium]